MSLRPFLVVLAALAGLVAVATPAAEPPAASAVEPPAASAVEPPAASAAESKPRLDALALVPKTAVAFVHAANLRNLEDDLKRFARETGMTLGRGDHPVLDLLGRRTGLRDGLDLDGPACIGFLDPKRFRERYTIYILPVADWDVLLKSTQGEEMTKDIYALTGTEGPRFVARRGKFAVVTSSIRTMDALADGPGIAESLGPETVARVAAASPMVYVNVRRLKDVYESEITTWFRAATSQLYAEPEAIPYADMLTAYLMGLAGFIDQMETAEAGLRFGSEGLSVDLAVRFVDGASMAEFMAAQSPGSTPIPAVTDRPLASAVTVRLDAKTRTDFALRATRFFLESSPRPEPLTDAVKELVFASVKDFVESLGEHMTFLAAPAAPGMGIESSVMILDLKDADQFRRSTSAMAGAWEKLADQMDLYLRFTESPNEMEIEGVPITAYVPRLRFGIPGRHMEFRERLRELYGPEGLVYRVAVVKDQAVIATGSDLALFKQTIAGLLKAVGAHEVSPAVRRLQTFVPADENVYIALSLPTYLGQSLLRGRTPADRIGTIDPGHELVGIGLRADKGTARIASFWPHEQIRLARELLGRAAPEIAEIPESLFKPIPEGPPKPGAAPPGPVLPPAPKTPAPPAAGKTSPPPATP